MKKIKILHVGLSSNLGGIEKYLFNMFENINHEMFEMDYLVFKGKKVCFYDKIIEKSNIYEITHRNQNYRMFLSDLKKFFINSNYDYIHFHLMEFSCFERIVLAKKYTNAKIILHSHIADHKLSSMKTKILDFLGKKIVLRGKDDYLKAACSVDAGKYMFKQFKLNDFVVLNNGIDVQEFIFSSEKRDAIRKKLNLEDSYVIGHIGRMVEQKNHIFLIDILKKMLEHNSNCKLLLIGNGGLKNQILDKAKSLNVLENIVFVDNTNDIQGYLSAMDVFVFPSLFEGLGIVLIEAQASGLNCFVTDSLPAEISLTNNLKRLSLKQSPEVWAKEILESTSNYDDREKINEVVSKSDFDVKKTAKIIENYYISNMGGYNE